MQKYSFEFLTKNGEQLAKIDNNLNTDGEEYYYVESREYQDEVHEDEVVDGLKLGLDAYNNVVSIQFIMTKI